jgi:hypothetical protein
MATGVIGNGTTNPTARSVVQVTADVYRYINVVGDDGWVNGRLDAKTLLPLCKYTKVILLGSKHGLTSFKVLDGTHAGKTLTMKDANAQKHLGTIAPKNSLIEVTITYGKYENDWVSAARGGQKLDQQWASLSADGITVKAAMNTVWGTGFYPIPAGEYTILTPDRPHDAAMTNFYRREEPSLKHDQVWFPIKYGDNSRYVHVGNVSDGCATVVDLAKWEALHEKLVSHRSKDKSAVGKLIVKGKPERAK